MNSHQRRKFARKHSGKRELFLAKTNLEVRDRLVRSELDKDDLTNALKDNLISNYDKGSRS